VKWALYAQFCEVFIPGHAYQFLLKSVHTSFKKTVGTFLKYVVYTLMYIMLFQYVCVQDERAEVLYSSAAISSVITVISCVNDSL